MFKDKGNIYFSWFLSYILILIIPIVLILVSYMLSVSVIEKEINKTHAASLQQLNEMMESTFSDIQNLAIEVSWNDKSRSISRYSAQNLSSVQRLNIANFIKNLKTLKLANNDIDSLFIYYKYNDFVLSNNGMCHVKDYYNIYVESSGVVYEDWINMLKRSQQNKFMPYEAINNKGQLKQLIAYIRSLPFEKYTESDATLMILLDMDAVYSWLDEMDWLDKGNIYIIDSNNSVIISNNNASLPEEINFDVLNQREDSFHLTVDGQEVLVSHIHSKVTDWKYVVMMPTEVYLEKARFIRNVMIGSIFCCLLAGGILSWVFTNRNYQSIRQIVNTVGTITGNTPDNKYITYRDIEKTIDTMIEKDQFLQNRLEKQNKILQKHFINRLITGQISDPNYIQSTFENYNINLKSHLFAVLLFYIEDFSAFYNKNEEHFNADESIEMVRFIITNIVEELINSKESQGLMIEIEDMLVCLVNIDSADLDGDWISEVAHTAQLFMKDKFGIIISVSISSIVEDIENINSAYQEAIEAMEYKKFTIGEVPRVIKYDSIKGDSFNISNTARKEEKFINCIKAGNYEEAKDIFNSIIKNNFYKPSESVKLMKFQMYGLINILINAIREISATLGEKFIEETKPFERLLACEDVKEFQQVANSILEDMHSYADKEKQLEDKEDLKAAIIKYIHENYADMNLNVSSVAQHFDVSLPYISKYFKKHHGVNLLDFIHSVRIEKAKALMREGNYTVEEIAHKVGYYSSISFIRSFKKYEKITPGQYMNL